MQSLIPDQLRHFIQIKDYSLPLRFEANFCEFLIRY